MTKLSKVLTKLMQEHNISSLRLAKETGVAQPVVYKLAKGQNDNPKLAALTAIAQYFSITISQLIGEIEIVNIPQTKQRTIPIITWEEATKLPETPINSMGSYIYLTKEQKQHDFVVLIMNDTTMLPLFPEQTLLIVDLEKIPQNKDIAIVHMYGQTRATCRQVFFDNDDVYLKPLNDAFKTTCFNKNKVTYSFKGVVIESRLEFNTNHIL